MRPATRRAILAQFPVGRTLRFSAIRRTFLQFLGDGPPAFSFLIAIRSRFSRRGPSTTGTGGIDKQKLKTSERSTQGGLCLLTYFPVSRIPYGLPGRCVMANKAIKKILKKKTVKRRTGKGVTRALAERVLAQGTGRVAARPFGGKTSVPRSHGLHPLAWDAFATAHAALPRSVGPYTIVRTSFLTQTNSRCGFIGTFKRRADALSAGGAVLAGGWSNCVMVTEEATTPIGTTAATAFHFSPFPGGAHIAARNQTTFTCCPSAISVQIMGPKALSEASGQIACAVVPARLDLTDDHRTWEAVQTDITSFFRPRLLSAGKLTLRGVQMDSHPLSMNDVSSFEPLLHQDPNPNTVTPLAWSNERPYPCGWAPMAFVNPTGADLQMLICVEWRVRFDVGNPAIASHSHHGVSSDVGWDQQIRRATDALPGVIDIVERVANTGMGMYAKASSLGLV